MRMCFMQETRRDSVSVNYVWKIPKFDHWVNRVSRALVFLLLGGRSSEAVPKQFLMMLKQVKSSQTREVLIPAERTGAGRTGFKQTLAFLDLGTPRRRKGHGLQPPIFKQKMYNPR